MIDTVERGNTSIEALYVLGWVRCARYRACIHAASKPTFLC